MDGGFVIIELRGDNLKYCSISRYHFAIKLPSVSLPYHSDGTTNHRLPNHANVHGAYGASKIVVISNNDRLFRLLVIYYWVLGESSLLTWDYEDLAHQ